MNTLEKEFGMYLKMFPQSTIAVWIYKDGEKSLHYLWQKPPLSWDPIYEIWSLTKVFTTLLLSKLSQEKKLSLEDSVEKIWGNIFHPQINSTSLEELACHVSWLPSFPPEVVKTMEDFETFTQKFSKNDFFQYLASPTGLKKKKSFLYSNMWYGILGLSLEKISWESYKTLLEKNIFQKFNMPLSDVEWKNNSLIDGYWIDHSQKNPVNWWDGTFSSAWAITSNLPDMLNFVENLLYPKSDFIKTSLLPTPNKRILWWAQSTWLDTLMGNKNVLWHNGATPGFWTFLWIDPVDKIWVVILVNHYASIDYIGLMLMRKIRKKSLLFDKK